MQYILWHKNPDTDSFCSALVYAQYLQDKGHDVQAIALGEPNNETKYIFEKWWINFPEIKTQLPESVEIYLVDHNEASQSIDQREKYIIKWVIDHHKVADFSTWYPLMMRLEPVWCTCTILAEIFQENNYIPWKDIASLMVSAIVSDTLYFKSPTTTERDKKAFQWVLWFTDIEDAEMYSLEMFDAKSKLSHLSAKEVVTMEYKTFDFYGTSVGIWVLETTNPKYALERKDELLQAIKQIKQETWLHYLLLCIVDILQEETVVFVASDNEKEIVEQVFGASVENNLANIWPLVSRKKQIVPPIDKYFS